VQIGVILYKFTCVCNHGIGRTRWSW